MNAKIIIQKRFSSQTNCYSIEGETHTLANPLRKVMIMDPTCEVPEYITTEQGIKITVRSKTTSSASSVLRRGLENLIDISENLHNAYMIALANFKERKTIEY